MQSDADAVRGAAYPDKVRIERFNKTASEIDLRFLQQDSLATDKRSIAMIVSFSSPGEFYDRL